MRDGHTRKLETREPEAEGSFELFCRTWRATLVIVAGCAEGSEYDIESRRVVLGRGGDSDLRFQDPAMSREHTALEFADQGYRVRDLGSMNGTLLNGGEVRVAELKHGDRLQMGAHVLQFVLEKRRRRPKTYVLQEDD